MPPKRREAKKQAFAWRDLVPKHQRWRIPKQRRQRHVKQHRDPRGELKARVLHHLGGDVVAKQVNPGKGAAVGQHGRGDAKQKQHRVPAAQLQHGKGFVLAMCERGKQHRGHGKLPARSQTRGVHEAQRDGWQHHQRRHAAQCGNVGQHRGQPNKQKKQPAQRQRLAPKGAQARAHPLHALAGLGGL